MRFFDTVARGTGFAHSRHFECRAPRIYDGEFPALLILKSLLKDVRLVRDLIIDAEVNCPGPGAILKTLKDSIDLGWADDELSADIKLVETRIGRTIAK